MAVSFFFISSALLLLCFCCDEWTQGQNGVYPLISPVSPDKRNAHSRWHYFGVCTQHATTPFISCEQEFTTYALTGVVNISNMTKPVIFLVNKGKKPASASVIFENPKENNKQATFSFFFFFQHIWIQTSKPLKINWGLIPTNRHILRFEILTVIKFLCSVWDYRKVKDRMSSAYVIRWRQW